jgi:hypothetical protein
MGHFPTHAAQHLSVRQQLTTIARAGQCGNQDFGTTALLAHVSKQRNWKPEPGNFAISLAYDPSTALRYHFAVGPAVTQSWLDEGHKMIHFEMDHTNIPLLWAGYQL